MLVAQGDAMPASQVQRDVESVVKERYREMVCEMPVGKITVSGLCSRSGISRKTFYAYFLDIDDVLAKILYEDITGPTSTIYPLALSMGEDVSSRLLNELAYKGILKHRDFYTHIVTRSEERLFIRALQRCLREAQDYANEVLGVTETDERYEYASRFLAAGQAAIIVHWIRGGMTTPTSDLGAWFNDWSNAALQSMAGRTAG